MAINVTTYLNQLGYGIAGLNVVKALAQAGHKPALWINGGQGQCPENDRAVVEAAVRRSWDYDISAPSLRIAHPWDMAHRVGRGFHSGMTFFELDRLTTQERNSLDKLSVVFVPSEWACGILRENGVVGPSVVKAPLGVDTSIFHPGVKPAFPDPRCWDGYVKRDATVFFGCGKWEIRKGHDLLCEAFSRAFTPKDNVILVMNCDNPFLNESQSSEWRRMYENSKMGEKVLVWPTRLGTQEGVASMMALADCGVFPCRAEGWNLPLLEMMAIGKHVIATNYAAHTEFVCEDNCLLVEPDGLEEAYDGTFFKGGGGQWAELGDNALESVVAHMRYVHRLKQSGQLGTNECGVKTARFFSWTNTAEIIAGALGE